jgi:glycosyltransferase involved in cell wall biosynthesis
MRPYFSVITPSFNQGRFIGTCLGSVAMQEGGPIEHWVIDNCSTDQTREVVAKYPDVHFVSEPDCGQSDAVNKGFQLAQGEIICWLNSDDAYPAGLFARLAEVFLNPEIQVVFGDVEQVPYDGSPPLRAEARFVRREDLVRWWSREARIHQPAVFFRRALREKTGLLREDIHYVMDYEYWWRMAEHANFHYVPEVLAIQHRQPESKTVRDWQKVYEERERVFEPHYGLIDRGNRRALLAEKRRAMCDRYLGEAYAAARDPRLAVRLLALSFRERPASVFDPRWLGLLMRMAGA